MKLMATLWKTYVYDIVIIGGDAYASYFHQEISRINLKSCLILPKRRYAPLNLETRDSSNGHILLWSQSYHDEEIIFPSPRKEEYNSLETQTGLPVDLLETSWDSLREKAELLPNQSLFEEHAKNIGATCESLYRLKLVYNGESVKDTVKKIVNSELSRVDLGSGRSIYSKSLCLVRINQLDLIEDYYDLDSPIKACITQEYVRLNQDGEGQFGSFLEIPGEGAVTLCYYQSEQQSYTRLCQDIPITFDHTAGNYCISGPTKDIASRFEFTQGPTQLPKIKHLFFRLKENPYLVLDFLPGSPERNLLLVIKGIVKMLEKITSGH